MNLKAGYPFWLIRSGLPFDYSRLDSDIQTDVLVLGGGISGALAAHYLVQAGIECVVVDARTIGLGSTCASTSLLQYEIDTPLCKLVSLVGEKHAVSAYHLCGDAILRLASLAKTVGLDDFHLKKSLYYAAYKKDVPFIKEEFAIRQKNGFKLRYLDDTEVAGQFGFEAPGAILSELGADTNSYLFTHRMHQYNIKRGLKVYDRTTVTAIQHQPKKVVLKTADGHTITCRKLVYATGYEVVEFISKPIVKLHSTYAIASEHLGMKRPFWKEDVLIWNTADPYLYMRSTPDNRILVGGRDEMFFSPVKRDKLIGAKSRQLKKDFEKIFPGISFSTEFGWTGTFGSTRDGLPYIGEYKRLPNSYFALGFGGNGITFSQVAAEMIVDLIKGRRNKDIDIFSFNR
jgi:glycine/D-amino acid oxidase-like deaminating enzyme